MATAKLGGRTAKQGITKVHCKCGRCREGTTGPRICRVNCSHPDRFSVRKRMPNGKRVERWFDRMTDAERFLADLVSEARHQPTDAPSDDVFAAVAERWLEITALDIETRTCEDYADVVRRVLSPVLGERVLRTISQDEVQALVTEWSAKLAPQTVRNRVNVLLPILRFGGRPITVGKSKGGIVLPKRQTVSQRLWLEDAKTLRKLVRALPAEFRLYVTFMATVGVRPGEAKELRYGDILNGQRVRVSRAVKRTKGQTSTVGNTKTGVERVVCVPPALLDAVKVEVEARYKRTPPPNALLFASGNNRHINPATFNRAWAAAKKDALPDWLHGLRAYDLRHTAASMLINRGASVLAVSRQLGHADAAITLKVYAHLFEDTIDALIGEMDDDVATVLGTDNDSEEEAA